MEDNVNKASGYYKYGWFYFEKNNKRLIVLSPNNRYTLNFANKWAYFLETLFFLLLIGQLLAAFGIIH